jgi:hypothetical protein
MNIADQQFSKAVAAIDAGDAKGLIQLLNESPRLIRDRLTNNEEGYFKDPYLLWFVAENPIRNHKVPKNIVEITESLILFAKQQKVITLQDQLDYTLALVCSGRVSREFGVQIDLIDCLIRHGANPNKAVDAAIIHGEIEAVEQLLLRGSKLTLLIIICLNRVEEINRLIPMANAGERQTALAVAAFYGQAEIIVSLIQSGVAVSEYCPHGFHSHSTPLHQAVWAGSLESVKALVRAGADLSIKDKVHNGTPLDWAEYGQRKDIVKYLKSL